MSNVISLKEILENKKTNKPETKKKLKKLRTKRDIRRFYKKQGLSSDKVEEMVNLLMTQQLLNDFKFQNSASDGTIDLSKVKNPEQISALIKKTLKREANNEI